MRGSRPGFALPSLDRGALASDAKVQGASLAFSLTEAQQADLNGLLAAQQDPTSPLYHQWLTPEQYAMRFGVADADIAKVETWLQQQGFSVDGVNRGRSRVSFSGTEGQIAAAFGTELHRFAFGTESYFAPASELSLPATLAPMVSAVLHLSDYRPKAQIKLLSAAVKPEYTNGTTQQHRLSPGDIATMYDLKATYASGYTGTGQAIAVIGQSYIDTTAVQSFRSAAGLSATLPSLVLVPGTGVSAYSGGDQGESELDVEYAGGIAPGASVFFVYTGDQPNANVFDSLYYAIDNDVAPVISGSYGACEVGIAVADANSFSAEVNRANLQGQTILFASGDEGSTNCYGLTTLTLAQRQSLQASFPSTVPGITGVGGTQMQAGSFSTTNTSYWTSATGSDVVSSLLSYVPEVVWNEDSAQYGLGSTGGGASTLFARPSWQAGVPGLPTGTTRLVPDISLQGSASSPGFVFCTTDGVQLAAEGLTNSCVSGFRSSTGSPLVAGGTSFATPIMAGMVAILNQVTHATGQGNINPTLYGLASNSANYGLVFHDITSGTNACTAGVTYCSSLGSSAFSATAGYDQATGLGTLDFGNLVKAWPATANSTSTKYASQILLNAATTTPASGASDVIQVTVSPGALVNATTPATGTVSIAVDGTVVATNLPLTTSFVNYTWPGTTTGGSHTIVAGYSGDANYLPSQGTITLTLAGSSLATGSFSLSAGAISVPYNASGSTSVVVAPVSGYNGVVVFGLSGPSTTLTLCYTINSVAAYNGATTPAADLASVLTIYEGTACSGSGSVRTGNGAVHMLSAGHRARMQPATPESPWRRPMETALAGVLLGAFALPRRSRRLSSVLGLALLGMVGFGLSGCGGGSGSTTSPTPVNPTQTYTLTVKGTDSVATSIASSTTFTLTVHP